MKCPTCQTDLSRTGKFWVCPEHGLVESEVRPPVPVTAPSSQNIFISYGRQDASDIAKRLAADLKERGGHEVFIDLEGIEKGGLFEVRIEQGIRAATVFAAVMTERSKADDSVCRDEVVFALNEGKNVVPLKADPNPQFKPSLLLARRNWIDFSLDYEVGIQSLLRFLQGDKSALAPPALPTITGVEPLDFGPEIARFTADFTGREWINTEIDRWLMDETHRALIIVAEPGVGKSAIAAWLTQVRSDVIGIHFCTQQNSRTRDPYEFVAGLVGQLHARLPGFKEAVEAKHPEIRRSTAGDAFRELVVEVTRALPPLERPRLIVVDSLDEAMEQVGETVLDVLVQQAADLPTWLRVIATTRPEEKILHRVRTLNVYELMAERRENREDVRHYIQRRLQTPLLTERLGGEVAEVVIEQLDNLSEGNYLYARMALDALADRSIYVDDLNQLSPGLTKFFYETFRKRFSDTELYERTLAPLVRALAAARGPLTLAVLQRVCSEPAEIVRRRLHDLRSYLRIQGEGETASYAVYHRSLKDWLTNPEAAGAYWCQTESGDRSLAEIGWSLYSEGKLNTDDYFFRYLTEHLIGAREWVKLRELLSDPDLFERIWNSGRKYEWMRYWQTLKEKSEPGKCYAAALDKKIQNGASPRRVAELSEIIGWFLRDMDLLSAAQPFTERALRLREEIFGNDQPEIAASIHSLAELHRAQKDFVAALPLYQRALEIREKHFGSESPEVAMSLHDLAEFHHDQYLLQRALRWRAAKQTGIAKASAAAKVSESFGDFDHEDAALRNYRHSLAIRRANLKSDDPVIADCLNDMAALQYETGNLDAALPNYQAAFGIYEKAYGSDHPDVAAALHNIARIYNSQGNSKGAISLCLRAFNILNRTFGPNHYKTQLCIGTLIDHYEAADKIEESVPLRRRRLEAQEQTLGPDHPEVESSLLELASRYKVTVDFENAADCYRRVLEIKEGTLASNSDELAAVLDALAWQFLTVNDFTSGVACGRRAVAIREGILGPDHPDTAASLNTLLRCLQEKGENEAALPLCRRVLKIREACLPADHPDIGVSLNNLGLTLTCLGRFDEAEQNLTRSIAISPGSPYPRYWLAKLYRQRGSLGDCDREVSEWRAYLELGSTSQQRHEEATKRLNELLQE